MKSFLYSDTHFHKQWRDMLLWIDNNYRNKIKQRAKILNKANRIDDVQKGCKNRQGIERRGAWWDFIKNLSYWFFQLIFPHTLSEYQQLGVMNHKGSLSLSWFRCLFVSKMMLNNAVTPQSLTVHYCLESFWKQTSNR